MAGMVFDDGRQAAKIELDWKLCRIERTIRECKNAGTRDRENIPHGRNKFRRVLACGFGLGSFDASFQWRQKRSSIHSLQRGVAVKDSFRDSSVAPKRNSVRSIKRISRGVVVMVVRIKRAHDGPLAQRTQGFILKTRSGWTHKPFQKQRGTLSDQQSAIA